MAKPFTNIHIHVFNSECAPENFLRIIDLGLVRRYPAPVKKFLQNKYVRKGIWKINGLISKKSRRSGLDKYLSFLNVGTQYSQMQIFEMAHSVAKNYDSEARVVTLTLNMDYMDNQGAKPAKNFATQIEEIKRIKTFYPDQLFPFLGVDPRAKSGKDLLNWTRQNFEYGVTSSKTNKAYPYFAGIKLYPGLGFFPFDPRLDALYAYAEANGIPIMTHCTRSGSQYVGSLIESLIPHKPDMIMPDQASPEAIQAQQEIYARIDRYYHEGWVKNSKRGGNDLACDLFGHPQNYVPVMLKYPKLKICLAHMGGSDEMVKSGTDLQRKVWRIDGENWAELTLKLMKNPYRYVYRYFLFAG